MHELLLDDILKFTIYSFNSPISCVSSLCILVNNTQCILADIGCIVLIRRIYIDRFRASITVLQN